MAQAFQTIYNRNYRKQAYSRRALIKQVDEFTDKPPSEGNWRIESTEENKIERSRKDLEELVDSVYNKRHRSTYFASYCHDEGKDTFVDSDQECSNELINRGARVFKKKTKKISPPLATSRRLWGYMRPDSLYAPLSTYQDEHDHLAFELLKGGLPKESVKAIIDENGQLNEQVKDVRDDTESTESFKPVKEDQIACACKKRSVQTLNGVVCCRPVVMKLIN